MILWIGLGAVLSGALIVLVIWYQAWKYDHTHIESVAEWEEEHDISKG